MQNQLNFIHRQRSERGFLGHWMFINIHHINFKLKTVQLWQITFHVPSPGWQTLWQFPLRTCAAEAVTAAPPGNAADTQEERPLVSAPFVSPAETRGCPPTERPHSRWRSGPQCELHLQRARRTSAAPVRRRLGRAWLRLLPRTLSKSWSVTGGRTHVESPEGGCRSWTPRRVWVPERNRLPEPSVNLEIPEDNGTKCSLF